MNKRNKNRFKYAIVKGGEAMLNRDYVHDLKGNKGVINKVDPDDPQWTFLIRFQDMTLKWMPWVQINFEKGDAV